MTLDPISAPPSIMNIAGRAWRLDLDRVYTRNGKPRLGHVASWLIEAPWAHPCWHSYSINLIHLRPLQGIPDPVIYLPGATHELWVHALDPNESRQEMMGTGIFRNLDPMNFGAQIIAETDAAAVQRVEREAVLPICLGELSPDTDFLNAWTALFGDNMVRRRDARR